MVALCAAIYNYMYLFMSQKLIGELSEAQQLALCLDDRIQDNVTSAQFLQDFAAG